MRDGDDSNSPPLTAGDFSDDLKAAEEIDRVRAAMAHRLSMVPAPNSTSMIRAMRDGVCEHCQALMESRREMRDSTKEEILLEIAEKQNPNARSWREIFAEIDEINRKFGEHGPIDTLQLIREGREERDQQLGEAIFGDTSRASAKD